MEWYALQVKGYKSCDNHNKIKMEKQKSKQQHVH